MATEPKEPTIYLEKLQAIVSQGFNNAAKGFSGMIGQRLQVANPSVRTINLLDIPMVLGGPENDAVGIYLRIEGDMSGQVIIILPFEKALELSDMLLEEEPGTTKQLGSMELSALAEVGNLTGTFFLNAMAELTGVSSRPSPPAVMVDMVGSIMDVIIATMGDVQPKVLMFQSNFVFGSRQTEANFWIIPDPATLEALKRQDNRVMANSIAIGLAEMKISKNLDDVLVAFGLGSCLGIGLYDPQIKLGGMLHAVLPKKTDTMDSTPTKYVDSGIQVLLDEMIKAGAAKQRLILKMAGGANMLNVSSLSKTFDIGNRNVESAHIVFNQIGMKLKTEEIGGKIGRTVRMYISDGRMTIRMMGEQEREF